MIMNNDNMTIDILLLYIYLEEERVELREVSSR